MFLFYTMMPHIRRHFHINLQPVCSWSSQYPNYLPYFTTYHRWPLQLLWRSQLRFIDYILLGTVPASIHFLDIDSLRQVNFSPIFVNLRSSYRQNFGRPMAGISTFRILGEWHVRKCLHEGERSNAPSPFVPPCIQWLLNKIENWSRWKKIQNFFKLCNQQKISAEKNVNVHPILQDSNRKHDFDSGKKTVQQKCRSLQCLVLEFLIDEVQRIDACDLNRALNKI